MQFVCVCVCVFLLCFVSKKKDPQINFTNAVCLCVCFCCVLCKKKDPKINFTNAVCLCVCFCCVLCKKKSTNNFYKCSLFVCFCELFVVELRFELRTSYKTEQKPRGLIEGAKLSILSIGDLGNRLINHLTEMNH
jgi:hypothetical protein